MPVSRIEQIDVAGGVRRTCQPYRDGKFRCFSEGRNTKPVLVSTLDEVADFLRADPGNGVRMMPGHGKIVDDIFIDGVRR